ncbi:MAG: phage holin family protein [Chitinivibrionales bacterium]|nr:phage holin family protein [Chitinivibrionales bacterium]
MLEVLLNLLLLAVAIFAVAKLLPAIHVRGFGTALAVAAVYSVINLLIGWLLVFITLPLVILTFGLFKLIINAFLLWLTDKLLPGFEIRNFGWTIIAAFLIATIDTLLHMVF